MAIRLDVVSSNKRWLAGGLLSLLFSGQVTATEADGSFCITAQRLIAGTAMTAQLEAHQDYDSFVKSKAFDKPLTVQWFESNALAGDEQLNKTLSCKMRTAERINNSYQAAGQDPVAVADSSCAAVHEAMLGRVLGDIAGQPLALQAENVIVDEEDMTFMGPMWLSPWPFEPAYTDAEGNLHLASRSLYVPFAWWIPMPDRFQGNYYCHLISPAYLRALMLGNTPLPGPAES